MNGTTPLQRIRHLQEKIRRQAEDSIWQGRTDVTVRERLAHYSTFWDDPKRFGANILLEVNDAAKEDTRLWQRILNRDAPVTTPTEYEKLTNFLVQDRPLAFQGSKDYLDEFYKKRKELLSPIRRQALDNLAKQIVTEKPLLPDDPLFARLNVTPLEDRQYLTMMIEKFARPEERGFVDKINESIRRGIIDAGGSLLDVSRIFFGDKKQKDAMMFRRGIQALQESRDPIKSEYGGLLGKAGTGFYNAIRMAPDLAATAVAGAIDPALPFAYWTMRLTPGEYEEMRRSGLSNTPALLGATASAAIQGAIEVIQIKQLTPSLKLTVGRAIRTAITTYLKETGEEGAQKATSIGIRALVGTLYGERSDVNWMEALEDIWAETESAAFTMPWLMLPGVASGIADAVINIKRDKILRRAFEDWIKTERGQDWAARQEPEIKALLVEPVAEEIPAPVIEEMPPKEEIVPPEPAPPVPPAVPEVTPEAAPVVPPAELIEAPAPEIAEEPAPPPAPAPTPPVTPRRAETKIEVPAINKIIDARYELRELDTLIPSHDFKTAFIRSNVQAGRYPAELQPRDYEIASEREKVFRLAGEKKALFYLSSHPAADSGPPVITPEGIVLNGNGRAMSLQQAAGRGDYTWYRDALREQAATFGLNPQDIDAMKNPVLVRVVPMVATSPEAIEFARAGNISTTQFMSPVRLAGSLNGLIDEGILEGLRLSADTTFSEAVIDPKKGKTFRENLQKNMPPEIIAQYFTPDGRLTDSGAELVRNMLLSQVLPVEVIERLGVESKGLLRTLEGSIPQLLQFRREFPAKDITHQLVDALDFLGRNPEARTLAAVEVILAQRGLFAEKAEVVPPATLMFVEFLLKYGNAAKEFRKRLSRLLGNLGQKKGLFGKTYADESKLIAESLDVTEQKDAKLGIPYGAMNRIITSEGYENAKKELIESLSRAHVGIPVDVLAALSKMGLYHFEAGLRKFSAWSAQMVKDAGEDTRKYLVKIWRSIKESRKKIEAMDAERVVTAGLNRFADGVRKYSDWKAGLQKDFPAVEEKVFLDVWRQTKKARTELPKAERLAREMAKPTPAQVTQKAIRKSITEFTKGEPVVITPQKLLNFAMKTQVKAAKIGYRAGQLDKAANINQALEFAKMHLPKDRYDLVARAATQAAKVRTKGDVEKIITAVNIMVGNYERASAFEEYKTTWNSIDFKRLDPHFAAAIKAFDEKFTLTAHREETLARYRKLLEFADRETDLPGEPYWLIEHAEKALAESGKPLLREQPASTIRALTDALKMLIHQNVVKQTLRFGRQIRSIEEMKAKATAEVAEWTRPLREKGVKVGLEGLLLKGLAWLDPDTLTEILCPPGSVARKVLFNDLRESQRTAADLMRASREFSLNELQKQGIDDDVLATMSEAFNKKKAVMISVPAPPRSVIQGGKFLTSVEMTSMERAGLIATLTDHNTHDLLLKHNQSIVWRHNRDAAPMTLKFPALKAIVESATFAEKTLARHHKQFMNSVLYNAENQTHQELTGTDLTFHNDWFARHRRNDVETDPNAVLQSYRRQRNLENYSYVTEREGGKNPIIIPDLLEEFHRFAAFVCAYTQLPAVHNAMRLLRNHAFRDMVKTQVPAGEKLLGKLNDMVKEYIGMTLRQEADIEKMLRKYIPRIHIGALGLKPWVMLVQTISVLNALVEIDIKYLFSSSVIKEAFTSHKRIKQLLNEASAALNERFEGYGHEILSPHSMNLGMKGFYSTKRAVIERISMSGIRFFDRKALLWIGLAAEKEGKSMGLVGKELIDHTARRTERIIERSQPHRGVLTTPSIVRGGALVRLLTLFSSQKLTKLNQMVREYNRFVHKEQSYGGFVVRGLFVPIVLTGVLYMMIRESYFVGTGISKRKRLADYIMGIVDQMLSNAVIVGDVAASIRYAISQRLEKGSWYGIDILRPNTMVSAIEDTVKGVADAIDATADVISGDKKWKSTAINALRSLARGIGLLRGLPLAAIERQIPRASKRD